MSARRRRFRSAARRLTIVARAFDSPDSDERGIAVAARAALVTGGSSGIGLAIARALGAAGYELTIVARRADKLTAAAETLRADGLVVNDFAADMTDEDAIVAAFDGHRERYGRLDVLVNNAGVGLGGEIAGYPTKKIDMQLAVNLRAVIIGTREGLPLLKAAGGEHREAYVFNTASIAGREGEAWLSVYAATKAAVINWTNGLQKELGESGVRATALSPAFVDTPMTDFVKEHVPAERMIQPADLAKTVLWLLSLSPDCRVPEVVFERVGDRL